MKNCSGLNKLDSIGGFLYIRGNDAIENLNGLEHLTRIDGIISIDNNAVLTSLSGIQNIDPATIKSYSPAYSSDLEVYNNPMLTECAVRSVCDLLALPGKTSKISGNKSNCNSSSEIVAKCGYVGIEDISQNKILVYPNPSHGLFEIHLKDNDNTVNIHVVSIYGQVLRKIPCKGIYNTIDLTNYPDGIYFLIIEGNPNVRHTKLIKTGS